VPRAGRRACAANAVRHPGCRTHRLRAHEEQPWSNGVGADDARDSRPRAGRRGSTARTCRRRVVRNRSGSVVGQLVARGAHVDRVGVVRRDLHAQPTVGQLGHARAAAAVTLCQRWRRRCARHVHQPVVGGGPDLASAVRRRRQAGAGGVHLRARGVVRERPAPSGPGATGRSGLRSGEIALPGSRPRRACGRRRLPPAYGVLGSPGDASG
jgi:hypothetical protein